MHNIAMVAFGDNLACPTCRERPGYKNSVSHVFSEEMQKISDGLDEMRNLMAEGIFGGQVNKSLLDECNRRFLKAEESYLLDNREAKCQGLASLDSKLQETKDENNE